PAGGYRGESSIELIEAGSRRRLSFLRCPGLEPGSTLCHPDGWMVRTGSRVEPGTAKGRNSVDRLEVGLDLRALGLEEGRQGEVVAQGFKRLIDIEAGAICGDFKEDAVGLAEIERGEIIA